MMKRVKPPTNMEKFAKAIEDFASNWKKIIMIGVIRAPPPIPPEFAIEVVNARNKRPASSSASIGKTFLCSQTPLQCS